ncbi:MAG: flagellar motor protein MotB [Candidatus Amulumruptor caecigallinarius]|nr:flagellar motor protein MotB [Candidatus Amulumruptor caecigallinarius]MCM1396216.1 flagellar motor protein MotB [Candidatus Amulumruptor caecigallinarius]MCM1453784.1 flagellar motor protein MotB [bacterium]
MRTSSRLFAIVMMASTLTLTGCVSKKKYAELQTRYDALTADYNTSQSSLAKTTADKQTIDALLQQARANNEDLKRQYAILQGNLSKSLDQNSQGNVNISKLVDEINASNKYIKELVAAKSKSDSLNMVLTNNLTRSLSRDDLKDVDVKVKKGVVYISLADNMLFRSGSYEISDRAMDVLGKIAKIIKDYKSYDVVVEGNTDDVPISKTNIRNNWDLSALRASSVVQVLQNKFDVDPSRLSAAGRGEYNPVADNGSADGRQRNRRTEIIITPTLDQFMELIDQAPDTDTAAGSAVQ